MMVPARQHRRCQSNSITQRGPRYFRKRLFFQKVGQRLPTAPQLALGASQPGLSPPVWGGPPSSCPSERPGPVVTPGVLGPRLPPLRVADATGQGGAPSLTEILAVAEAPHWKAEATR